VSLELDADEVVGAKAQVLVGDRWAQDVLDQRLAAAKVVGAGMGRGVQREAQLRDCQRRSDDDAGPARSGICGRRRSSGPPGGRPDTAAAAS